MTKAESILLAPSVTLVFLQVPPAIIFYDKIWNTPSSALLSIPCLLLLLFIIIEQFHYKIHTCNLLYDFVQYRCLDHVRISAAEAINAKTKRVVRHIVFLRDITLVLYLKIRFSLHNLTLKYLSLFGKSDVRDVDLYKLNSTLDSRSCSVCQVQPRFETEVHNMKMEEDSENSDTPSTEPTEDDENDLIWFIFLQYGLCTRRTRFLCEQVQVLQFRLYYKTALLYIH